MAKIIEYRKGTTKEWIFGRFISSAVKNYLTCWRCMRCPCYLGFGDYGRAFSFLHQNGHFQNVILSKMLLFYCLLQDLKKEKWSTELVHLREVDQLGTNNFIMYILTTLEFPNHNHDFHILQTYVWFTKHSICNSIKKQLHHYHTPLTIFLQMRPVTTPSTYHFF